jgi:hypothetical protein
MGHEQNTRNGPQQQQQCSCSRLPIMPEKSTFSVDLNLFKTAVLQEDNPRTKTRRNKIIRRTIAQEFIMSAEENHEETKVSADENPEETKVMPLTATAYPLLADGVDPVTGKEIEVDAKEKAAIEANEGRPRLRQWCGMQLRRHPDDPKNWQWQFSIRYMERHYWCPYCPRSFSEVTDFYAHFISEHIRIKTLVRPPHEDINGRIKAPILHGVLYAEKGVSEESPPGLGLPQVLDEINKPKSHTLPPVVTCPRGRSSRDPRLEPLKRLRRSSVVSTFETIDLTDDHDEDSEDPKDPKERKDASFPTFAALH